MGIEVSQVVTDWMLSDGSMLNTANVDRVPNIVHSFRLQKFHQFITEFYQNRAFIFKLKNTYTFNFRTAL